MDFKNTSKKIASGALSVALASAGCSNGHDNGPVDPAPSPLVCNDVAKTGTFLSVTGTVTGTTLDLQIFPGGFETSWIDAKIINPQNVTVTSIMATPTSHYSLGATLELANASVTSGSFTLQAKLSDKDGNPCSVTRTFTFTINNTILQVSQIAPRNLPLAALHRASIELLHQDECKVELKAITTFKGPCYLSWTVTGGELFSENQNRICWQLPKQRGFYQAQVVADFGPEGFAFDAITLEVV